MTASTSTLCSNDPSTISTPFDPPASWDGSCSAADAIAKDALCGAAPCVQSVTIAPPVLNESGCVPKQPPIAQDVVWGSFARACEGTAQGRCPSSGQTCAPRAPSGFMQCVSYPGDVSILGCPPEYNDAHQVVYLGATDSRMCSPCTCGSPQGSTCSTLVSFYTDSACSAPLASNTVTSAGPSCIMPPIGSALGSKAATPPVYTPGACTPSGGEAMGNVELIAPLTICCRK
jgi:hypothetical protein